MVAGGVQAAFSGWMSEVCYTLLARASWLSPHFEAGLGRGTGSSCRGWWEDRDLARWRGEVGSKTSGLG